MLAVVVLHSVEVILLIVVCVSSGWPGHGTITLFTCLHSAEQYTLSYAF